MNANSSVLWAVSDSTLGIYDKGAAKTRGHSLGVTEVAERILGYLLVPSDAAAAMSAWSYADQNLQIAESFLDAAVEVWPEY